ncbi:MAG TPA: hypothetical protein EYO33_31535 [Phycisphaerales bacterium]|nr:hypothetical protein [Phycisphaerales bacterium]
MESGFLVEQTAHDEGVQVCWHLGDPRPSGGNFLGIDINSSGKVGVDPESLKKVTQYCCEGCGFLEAYAH